MPGKKRVISGARGIGIGRKLDMHIGDDAMSIIPSLSVAVSMRTLRDNGAGQLVSRERKHRAALTKVGSGGTFLPIENSVAFNNHPVLRVNDEAGVDVEPIIPLTKSFIIVVVGSFSAETLGESAAHRIINLYDSAGTRKGGVIGGGATGNGGLYFSPQAATTVASYQYSNFTANVPWIMAFQWNEVTKRGQIFKNSLVSPVASGTNAAITNNIQPGDYWAIWKTNQALKSIGGDYAELYIINEALRDGDSEQQALLQNAWDELKLYYGIA